MLAAAPTCKRYRGALFRLAGVVGGVATLFFLTANASAGEHQPKAGASAIPVWGVALISGRTYDVGNGNGKGPDRLPPTTPLGAAVKGATSTSVDLAWIASTDNVGVAGYGIYVNGSLVATTVTTSFTLTGLSCGSSYTFAVDAYDKRGNRSEKATFTGSTGACPPVADTQPPTPPGGFKATSATATSMTVAWTASTDNVGVAGYDVYNGSATAGTTPSTSYTVSGLSCGVTYTLAVDAYDKAGNHSSRASFAAPTSACAPLLQPAGDTQAPTVPGGLHVTAATAASITVAWTASTDNVGVTGYGLYRSGASTGSTSTTSATFSGLACGTGYALAVDAYDAAGNRSTKASITASTSACPPLGTSLPPRLPESSGGSLYVSLSGSDANPCTEAAPCRNMSRAFGLASNGTTIFVRGGTYAELWYLANRSFSATNPLTIRNYPGEVVNLVGTSQENNNAITLQQVGGIRVRGDHTSGGAFKVQYPRGAGVKIDRCQDCEVDGLYLANNGRSGLYVGGNIVSGQSGPTSSRNVQVWNNEFANNGGFCGADKDWCPGGYQDPYKHDHAIYYGGGNTYGTGTPNGTQGGVIANNVIHNQDYGYAMRIGDAATDLIITNNTVANIHNRGIAIDPQFYKYWGAAFDISADAHDQYSTDRVRYVNNIAEDVDNGFGGNTNFNTSDQADYNDVHNLHVSVAAVIDSAWPDNFATTNYGAGGFRMFFQGTHNLRIDPLFVSATDWHLQAGSTVRGKADPAFAPPRDKDGNARPAAPAMGAYN